MKKGIFRLLFVIIFIFILTVLVFGRIIIPTFSSLVRSASLLERTLITEDRVRLKVQLYHTTREISIRGIDFVMEGGGWKIDFSNLPDTQLEKDLEFKEFFDFLYIKYKTKYEKLRKIKYKIFCRKFKLDENDESNIETFHRLYFYHDLFTGKSAENFSYSGAFKIPYFWHWVRPNPRHEIKVLPGKSQLNKMKSPERFNKYKNFADIDRTPSLFLCDLISDSPKYYHEKVGEFYTFGWCSEREMSFLLLMQILGYSGKIYQDGIHVQSRFWVPFKNKDNKMVNVIITVDNTFDIFKCQSTKGKSKDKWLKDYGEGESVNWYNKKAVDEEEIKIVRELKISYFTQLRIRKQIKEYFNF